MFKKIMKKFLGNILLAIGIVIGVPILLIVSIGYLFYVPFDIVRYHKMPYYIDLKRKYEFFITSSEAVKVYNHITREKLPMKYFKNEDSDDMRRGGCRANGENQRMPSFSLLFIVDTDK